MTTTPQRLDAAITDVLATWATETGQPPPSSLFCAEAHPLDESTLCRRLDGHPGVHAAAGDDVWDPA
jgi:hypothetical protein